MQADIFCAGQLESEKGSYLPTMAQRRQGLCLQSLGLFDAQDIVGSFHGTVHSSSVSLVLAKRDTQS